MPAVRRKFTTEDKLDILQQASQLGITNILRKYNLSYSVFSRWKQQLTDRSTSGSNNAQDYTDILVLKDENVRLKKIIADQALAIELKNEELKRLTTLLKKSKG